METERSRSPYYNPASSSKLDILNVPAVSPKQYTKEEVANIHNKQFLNIQYKDIKTYASPKHESHDVYNYENRDIKSRNKDHEGMYKERTGKSAMTAPDSKYAQTWKSANDRMETFKYEPPTKQRYEEPSYEDFDSFNNIMGKQFATIPSK